MNATRTIAKIRDKQQQQAETYRYWQTRSVGERPVAVWEASEAAHAFKAAFWGAPLNDSKGYERIITRVQRAKS
jgi:hypothetical protein